MAVEGIPADFVAMACKRFIQGQVVRPNLTWRPSPAELGVEARRLRDKALDHERLSNLRLAPPPSNDPPDPTPEERQRAAEMWARTKREIEAATNAMRMPRKPLRGRSEVPAPDPRPEVDVSDFPPANASPSDLKAWEERQKAAEGRAA